MLVAQNPLALMARPPALAALGATAMLLLLATLHGGGQMALLAGIGLFAGLALYHASFGFTAAWRRFILERRSAGLRAQLIMLGVASLVFFPALATGSLLGQPVGGYVFPVGVALVTGAFLFGLGMQLGGGCGSGTLFTIGGGSVRMVVTLVFFIIGSTLASAYAEHWFQWPKFAPVSIVYSLGWVPALVVMILGLAGLYAAVSRAEKARHGALASIRQPRRAGSLAPGR